MKTRIKESFVLGALAAALSSTLVGRVTAQTFTTLHSFSGGSDGANPAGLMLSGGALYGTAEFGGSSDEGTVFKINTDGTGFTNLYSFSATPNSDGASPEGGLVLSGSTLYGTASWAGSSGFGTVFAINTNGTGFRTLHSFGAFTGRNSGGLFTNTDGVFPKGSLVLSGNTLFGTASQGGSQGVGTVFAVHPDGSGFTTLHTFTSPGIDNRGFSTNADGAYPSAGLILSGNTLYGTALSYGSFGYGTVFKLNTDGTGFTTLHNFTDAVGYNNGFPINGDGVSPNSLIVSGNTLYGTATVGGSGSGGTVFALNIDGTGFTLLHSFSAADDGARLDGAMVLSGGTLCGTTWYGGIGGGGTVFAVNTDGTGFATLHAFTDSGTATHAPEGPGGAAGLILAGSTLFGTTVFGGSSGYGKVFSLSFMPYLIIAPSGGNLILSWPTDYAGFDYGGYTLESTTNLTFPVWSTNSAAPVAVNGQNTVTNPISGTQQFFRLSQ